MEWAFLTVEELWHLCKSNRVGLVAKRSGRSPAELVSEFKRAGLLGNGEVDPSPEDIARETAKFRQGWDRATEQARWIAAHRPDAAFV